MLGSWQSGAIGTRYRWSARRGKLAAKIAVAPPRNGAIVPAMSQPE